MLEHFGEGRGADGAGGQPGFLRQVRLPLAPSGQRGTVAMPDARNWGDIYLRPVIGGQR